MPVPSTGNLAGSAHDPPLGVCPGAGRLLTAVCAPMLGNNALRYLEADHLGAQRAADD